MSGLNQQPSVHGLLSPEEVENLDYMERMQYSIKVSEARHDELLTEAEYERYQIACMSVADRKFHYMMAQHFADLENGMDAYCEKRGLPKLKELQARLRTAEAKKNTMLAGAFLTGIVIGYLLAWLFG